MIIGLVGKPSAGKSTFFKSLTLAEVDIGNFPFTTINPNKGAGFIKMDCVDTFFNTQCNPREGMCVDHKRFTPVEVIDVAGLVPGAHENKGMGNKFLNDLNEADALIHVVDISGSTNEKGEDVEEGAHDPAKDIKFLEDELNFWFNGILAKGWDRFKRQAMQESKSIDESIAKQLSGLKVTVDHVKEVLKETVLKEKHFKDWDDNDLLLLCSKLREKAKPILIAANKIDIGSGSENFERIRKEFPNLIIIPCSAGSELALKEANKQEVIKYIPGENNYEITSPDKLSDAQKAGLEFIKANVLDKYGSTGVQDAINAAVFDLLKYIAIFPGGANKLGDKDGNILPDVFLMPEGSTALDFAFKIHSDIGNNFKKAVDAKTKRTIGKDHVLKHMDVLEIMV